MAFILDFPLFEYDEGGNRWDASHHPFTSPKPGYEQYIETDPGRVIANCYDLIGNGEELGSGSIRVHDRRLQERIFGVLGYTERRWKNDSVSWSAPSSTGLHPTEALLRASTGC